MIDLPCHNLSGVTTLKWLPVLLLLTACVGDHTPPAETYGVQCRNWLNGVCMDFGDATSKVRDHCGHGHSK